MKLTKAQRIRKLQQIMALASKAKVPYYVTNKDITVAQRRIKLALNHLKIKVEV